MNLIELVRKSRLQIENVQEESTEPELILANYVINEKVISKYLIKHVDAEFIKMIAENVGFLKQFEKEYLENVFFSIEGDLGWNIYLVFVLDDIEFEKLILKDKFLIENNEDYARKIVIKENDFLKYIPVGQIINEDKGELINDPIVEWSNQLEKDNLYFTLMSYNKNTIENYINGNLEEYDENYELTSEENEINDQSINIEYLQLGNGFRDHCFKTNAKLEFGKVNLLSGVNGCGKTSILEAIELTMTGGIKKNTNSNESEIYKKDLESNCLLKFDNGEMIDVPRKSKETKKRESFYYQNKEKRISKLNRAFHQYNYYSYEDTFAFCFLDDQPNYSDEFSKIIFGENAKTTEKNWCRYKLEFENRLKEIDKFNGSLINQKNIISEIATTIDTTFTLEPLIKLMDKININYSKMPDNSETQKIKEWLNNQKIVLTSLKMEINNILKRADVNTKEEVQHIYSNKCIQNEDIINKLKPISEEINKFNYKIDQSKERLGKITHEKSRLDSISKELKAHLQNYNLYSFIYNNINKSNEILKLVSTKNEMINYIKKLEYIKNEWANILELTISDLNVNEIDDKIEGLEIKESKLKLDLQEIIEGISKEEEKKSVIAKVISQIKVLGKQYITESPESKTCPLCGKIHNSNEEFLNSINDSMLIDDSEYKQLLQNKSEIIKVIDDIDKNIQSLKLDKSGLTNLYEANKYISDNKILEKEFDLECINQAQMRDNVSKILKLLILKNSELENINSKLGILRLEGIKYENVKDALYFINLRNNTVYDLLNSKEVEKVKTSLEAESQIISKQIEEVINQINSYNELINTNKIKLSEAINAKKDLEVMSFQINREKTDIEDIIKDIKLVEESGILKVYNISYKKLVGYLDDIIIEIANINEIIEKKINQTQKLQQIAKLNEQIKENDEVKQRCEKAINILGKLKLLEKYCEEFIKLNIRGISNLFTSLHSPREFEKLDVDDNGKIVGYRDKKHGELPVPVFMMSTGQRSAVVLSIFIKLHMNMKSAPNFILLDEPVANIDDLNILALLDFLREVSISNKTQIFFTTANQGVAKLFKRKFSYLEEKFCDFKFKRYGNEKTVISQNTYNNINDIPINNLFI